MHPADIQTVLRARPFQPFRIVLSDGMNYEVRHPELVLLTLGAAHVGYPVPGQEGVAHHVDIIGLQLVSRLEYLEQPAPSVQGNGSQS